MKTTTELESADSLISAIKEEEERQEARATQAISEYAAKEEQAAREFTEREIRKEEELRASSEKELQEYAENEPKAIMEACKTEANSTSATLQENAKKNAKRVSTHLLKQLLSFSFLTRP